MNMGITIAQTAYGPIEYRREGSGPVVLVLNGGHCSRHTRLSHERLASAGYTVITPSRPGYDATPDWVGRTAQQAADALAALLDHLQIATVDVVGISAAGPTALAFAQRHPDRISRLILESAVTSAWDADVKRHARRLFGRAERLTWAMLRFALRVMPVATMRMMMREFTTRPIDEVWRRMTPDDVRFVRDMLWTMRSGTGFLQDMEHRADSLATIRAPVLVMYSPYDKSVLPHHAACVAREVPRCEAYEVPADTHLIWMGRHADDVWRRRLDFLQQPVGGGQAG